MVDTYHKHGGGRHHKGGPRRQLSIAAGAPIKYPNMRRPPGRTLAAALHTNNYMEQMAAGSPMVQSQPVAATRIGGRQGPLVAGPARTRRPR